MSELKLIEEDAVMRDKEPMAAALFERVQPIAGRDLRELLGHQEEVPCHHAAKRVVFQHCIVQCRAVDA